MLARTAGIVASLLLVTLPAAAATYYVAPDGDDGNDGSEEAPFASAERGQEAADPGDTVYFRGGEYAFVSTSIETAVTFNKSGAEGAPIRYWAYPGEKPIFDFFELLPQARVRGFSVVASWLHFKGLELRGVQQILTDVNESWAIRVENGASNNIFEALDIHHNEGPGLFIADGSNNLVLNCDSHHNWDPDRNGENADGFGCHSNDAGNLISGCRAWYNSDDGFDFINAPGGCAIEHSWAFLNGFQPDTNTGAGNGSGIKAGGFGLDTSTFPANVPRHQVRFNVSFANRSAGFYANHHPGGIDWFNNTAFDNPRNFDMLADVGAADHYLRNNLALGSALAQATESEIDDDANSWSLPVEVSEADFVSVAQEEAQLPRNADGSLPEVGFMHLVEGSDLVNAGEDVGFEFEGTAPDLGAFELGADDNPPGTGGGLATGGVGNAGAPASGGASSQGGSGGTVAAGGMSSSAGAAGAETSAGGAPVTPVNPGAGGMGAAGAPGAAGTPSPDPATPGTPGVTPPPATAPSPGGTPPAAAGGAAGAGVPSPMPSASPSSTTDAPAVESDAAGDDGGCGCRVGGSSRAHGAALLFGLIGLVAALRRKRRGR